MSEDGTGVAEATEDAASSETTATETAATETAAKPSGVTGVTSPEKTEPAPAKESAASDGPKWWESIEDPSVRETAKRFETPAEAAKGFHNANAKLMTGLTRPGDDATPEEVAQWRSLLGVPESPSGYEVPKDGLPEGLEFDQSEVAAASELFHKIGINADQAAEIMRFDAQRLEKAIAKNATETEAQRTEWENELREEFGPAYDDRMALAVRGFGLTGDEALGKLLEAQGLDNHPAIVKHFAKIGKDLAEHSIIGSGANTAFVPTPGEAQKQISMLRANEDFMKMYTNPQHTGHAGAAQKMSELYAIANPEPVDQSEGI